MSSVRTVRVRYHFEDEGWWAESEDLKGWTAVGKDFDEIRAQVRAGIPAFVEEPVSIVEEGVPEYEPTAGVWMPLSGVATASAFVTSFGFGVGVPIATVRESGSEIAEPSDALERLLVRGN